MIKPRKVKTNFGSLARETPEDIEDLKDAIEHEYNKAQEWRRKYEDLHNIYVSKTKKQLGLF